MGFSSNEAAWCFHREIRRKRAMCYRPRRRRFPLDGFWRPGPEDVAPALIGMADEIEAEVIARQALAASEERETQEDCEQLPADGKRHKAAAVCVA